MSTIFRQLLLQFLLIALNAFFAATEIAVISLNNQKMKALADDGDKKATKILKILDDPTKFLSTIQVGITLAGFLGSAFAADSFGDMLAIMLQQRFELTGAKADAIQTISVILVTLILSYFTLVLGELVPKRIAMKHKEKVAKSFCGVVSVLTTILKPVIWFLTISTNGILRLFGIDPNEKDETVSEEDIVTMLDAGADEGGLDEDDVEYIKNVFKLDNLTAADVMTQRSSIVAIPDDITEKALIKIIKEEGYSRIPVYTESLDKIIGVLYAREYLLNHTNPKYKLENAMFPPKYVPETMHLDALLKEMQDTHNHIAIVVNEYGVTSGVVSMEDIIEELVGEIWDELDEAIEPIKSIGEDKYRVLSTVSLDEFFTFFEIDSDEESDSTTVNGWVNERAESIPDVGFTFDYNKLSIVVTKADDIMSHEIEVYVKPEEITSEEEDSNE
ncbi:MAG: HlyC/CorC family transporter [Clostridia bacterium]|nr:HlyC/CorC family transporter [Clostridia bacterium]